MGSLDQIVEGEGVSAIHFATSFPHRGEFHLSPCLYVGTTLGSVLVIVIHLPEAGDPRCFTFIPASYHSQYRLGPKSCLSSLAKVVASHPLSGCFPAFIS
jgi:hypothetical protein